MCEEKPKFVHTSHPCMRQNIKGYDVKNIYKNNILFIKYNFWIVKKKKIISVGSEQTYKPRVPHGSYNIII